MNKNPGRSNFIRAQDRRADRVIRDDRILILVRGGYADRPDTDVRFLDEVVPVGIAVVVRCTNIHRRTRRRNNAARELKRERSLFGAGGEVSILNRVILRTVC